MIAFSIRAICVGEAAADEFRAHGGAVMVAALVAPMGGDVDQRELELLGLGVAELDARRCPPDGRAAARDG